jgi:hypothetical protein
VSGGIGWTAEELVFVRPDGLRYRFAWSSIRRIAAAHPWPTVEVDRSVEPTPLVIRPWKPALPRTADQLARCESFAEGVATLFDATDLPGGLVRERGWLDLPEVPWERADGLPDEERAAGAYRSGGLSREVVARRVLKTKPRASMVAALHGWLGRSRAERERDTLRQVVVTADRVAVEMWDGTVWRLPLEALAARVDDRSDRVYVFGRRTFLVLAADGGCPVLEALDARIGARVPAR